MAMNYLIRATGRVLHYKLIRNSYVQWINHREKSASVQSPELSSLTTNEQIKHESTISLRKKFVPTLMPDSLVSPLAATTISESIEKIMQTDKIRQTPIKKSVLPYEEIPGPAILKLWEKYWKYVPILGRLSWNRNITPMNYLFDKYGPVVRINGPMMGDIVMIHRPEHIGEVMKQESDSPIRSGVDILEYYCVNHRKSRVPEPFSTHDPEWLKLKSQLAESMAQCLEKITEKLNFAADEFMERIREIRNLHDEVPITFDKELLGWSMEGLCSLMFHRQMGFINSSKLNAELSKVLEAISTGHLYLSRCETGFQVWRFIETPYCRKLFEACNAIDGVMSKYIRESVMKAQSRSMKNPADTLPKNLDEVSLTERLLIDQRMTPNDLSTVLLDFIIFGVQAVSNTQAFLLYFLAKNPRIQQKLFSEIIAAMPDNKNMGKADLGKMPYLQACLKECLRLRPVFPYLTRLLRKDISLHHYEVPKGTYVIMANGIASRREQNFEDPDKFLPERWFDANADKFCNNTCLNFMTFGHGARSCLGKNFAEVQIQMLTAKLIRKFIVEYDYGDIDSKLMIVNVPNKPLRFRFVDRSGI